MKNFKIIILLLLVVIASPQEDELDNPNKKDKEEISQLKYILLLVFIGLVIGMAQTGGIGGG